MLIRAACSPGAQVVRRPRTHDLPGAMHSWPIHEAKARLSELVKRAQRLPQQLTSRGEPVAVLISAQEWVR